MTSNGMKRSRTSRRFLKKFRTHVRKHILLALSLSAVLLGTLSFSTYHKPVFTSAEVHFADTSPAGLQIMPASCPSRPHNLGDCCYAEGAYYSQGIYYSQATYCSSQMGNSCYSSNACDMRTYGSIRCDGSCSAIAPADSLCPLYNYCAVL